jgi:hypothetical protein
MNVPGGAAAARRRWNGTAAQVRLEVAQLRLLDVDDGEQGAGPCGDDERYTSEKDLEWCRRIAGVDAFTLDVAACEAAHCAPLWFGIETNGLLQLWHGDVWCNPPYSSIELWTEKAWSEWRAGRVRSISMLLPATRTEQPWWQRFVEPYRDQGRVLSTHNLPGRPRFRRPGSAELGAPPFGCVLLVWRARADSAHAMPPAIRG